MGEEGEVAEFNVVSDLLGTLLMIWLKAKAVNDIWSRLCEWASLKEKLRTQCAKCHGTTSYRRYGECCSSKWDQATGRGYAANIYARAAFINDTLRV